MRECRPAESREYSRIDEALPLFERLAEVPLRLLASAVGLNYDRAKVAAATGAGAALLGPSALVLLFELSSLPLDLLAAERHFLDFQEIVLGAVEDVGRGSARPLSDAAQEVGGFAEAMFPQPATGAAQSGLGLTEDRTAALLAGLGSAARAARSNLRLGHTMHRVVFTFFPVFNFLANAFFSFF